LVGFVGQWVWFSLPGEVWGWALFYAGIAALAFGSAYYHLKPDDSRVTWDTLPVSISIFIRVLSILAVLLYHLFCFLFEKMLEKERG
jgi:hypothetical protein